MSNKFVAGDTASKYRVSCIDDDTSEPLDLTGCSVLLRWKSRDGSIVEKPMTIMSPATAGVAEYKFAEGELVAPQMKFDVKVTNSDDEELTNINLLTEPVRQALA